MKKVLSVLLTMSMLLGMFGFTTVSAAEEVAFTFEQDFETMVEDLTSATFENESGLGHEGLGGMAGQATYSIYNVLEDENINALKIIPASTTFGEYGDVTRGNLNYKFPAPVTSGNITATFKMRKEGFDGGVLSHRTGSFGVAGARYGGVCTYESHNVKNLCDANCQTSNGSVVENSIDRDTDGFIPINEYGWSTLMATADWNSEGTGFTASVYQYDYTNEAWDLIITSTHTTQEGISHVHFGSFLAQDMSADMPSEEVAILFDDIKITTTQAMPKYTTITDDFEDYSMTDAVDESTWFASSMWSNFKVGKGSIDPQSKYLVSADTSNVDNKVLQLLTSGGDGFGETARTALAYIFPSLITKGEISLEFKIKYNNDTDVLEYALGSFQEYVPGATSQWSGDRYGEFANTSNANVNDLQAPGMLTRDADGWLHIKRIAYRASETEPWTFKLYDLNSATPGDAVIRTGYNDTTQTTNPLYAVALSAIVKNGSKSAAAYVDDVKIVLPYEAKLTKPEMIFEGTGGSERVVAGLKLNNESSAAIRWFNPKTDVIVKCVDDETILQIDGSHQHPGTDNQWNTSSNDENDNSGSMCIMMKGDETVFSANKKYVLSYRGIESSEFYGHKNTFIAAPVVNWSTTASGEAKTVSVTGEVFGPGAPAASVPIVALYNNDILVGVGFGTSVTPSTLKATAFTVTATTTEDVTDAKLLFVNTISNLKPMRAVEVLSSVSFQ